jgi:hypothetical protein
MKILVTCGVIYGIWDNLSEISQLELIPVESLTIFIGNIRILMVQSQIGLTL